MTKFDVSKGNFCVPVIEGRVVPQCRLFTLLPNGRVAAECLRLNEELRPFAIGNELQIKTLLGEGYAIPIAHPGEFENAARSLPVIPLEELR